QRSEQIAVCPHQPQLLSDTIYNNITLGEGGDISAVLRDVCFLEDLRAMPQGVDTVVGSNGIRLSGGQQARIALARTLYRNASLIILDDPFSAVDMVSEQRMLENLKQRYRDRIILLISHRLTVFPAVDRVLLLHSDKTSEIGTHRELLAQSAAYRALYALQKGGKTDES
ncbi:MAG: ABC transporter ATP-binding protein, partial [Pygmaiobacter sp.]